jgi:AhpD family alkylhydroperoxidase
MTKRIALSKTAGAVYLAIDALDASVDFDPSLRELVRLRASQLNGCSYCVDYHAADARSAGESERRVAAVAAWRGNPLFDERERAAFALTDAITQLPLGGVPDDVYAEAARHFDAAELGNLIGAIIAINAWNAVGVATGLKPEVEPAVATGA